MEMTAYVQLIATYLLCCTVSVKFANSTGGASL